MLWFATMAILKFAPEALVSLDVLLEDPTRSTLVERLNVLLDVLEAEPTDPRVRRRRFTDPPLWCFVVAGSHEDWAVLWSPDAGGDPVVVHLGPIPF
ncbi:MAG: hypothetical protein R2701_10640 [Acidimicrobiales bacterium]